MEIIKINAMWCSACVVMNNIWNEVLEEIDVKTTTLDYDFDEEEVEKYNPGTVLPVFIIMEDGKELRRIKGEHTKEEMLEVIREK